MNEDNSSVSRSKHETFLDCLAILFNNTYKLIDAYPTLCRVYAIVVAIPVTSATAGRKFFATLIQMKSRLRSSILQNRLGFMLMSTERRILMNIDKERVINIFGKSSRLLTDALL